MRKTVLVLLLSGCILGAAAPVVVFGSNGKLWWGISFAMEDVKSLAHKTYVEKPNPPPVIRIIIEHLRDCGGKYREKE